MQRLRQVALLIETSRAYGRGVLLGVARYLRERGHWLTHFQPHGLGDPPPRWLKGWRGDGVLARVDSRRLAAAVRSLGVPVVNLRSSLPDLPFPFLGTDNRAVAELGAEHLLERGFRNFAFFGFRRGFHPGLDRRATCFQERIESAGFRCPVFLARGNSSRGDPWELEQERLERCLIELPKPVGVMTCNDDCGMQVLNACRRADLMVPDQIGVIGVDNDPCLCNLSVPPLTSVEIDCERIGYEAAALLDRLMAGAEIPRRLSPIPPRGVVSRRSTDGLAVDDPQVARAIRFVRDHACSGIRVGEVFDHAGASRASLAPRLRQILGHNVQKEIQRVQIARAKDLLVSSGLPIKEIAHAAGFCSVQYMTRVFRSVTGGTPAKFRNERCP